MKKHKGLFVTFEGIDGSGKSTQARKAIQWLKGSGHETIFIREPGGTPISEKIRRLLLNRDLSINATSELLLYEAARAQLTKDIIIPALKDGKILICDRFFDSTIAYQGYGRGLDLKAIDRLNSIASFGIVPDLTFIIDVNYSTSLKRRKAKPDRLENEKRAFFSRVRRGFIQLSRKRRSVLIDGNGEIEEIFAKVKQHINRRLKSRRTNA